LHRAAGGINEQGKLQEQEPEPEVSIGSQGGQPEDLDH
jgi:hypothetical protein